jgi:RNA polymerase sigma factor (sigma-70 family)
LSGLDPELIDEARTIAAAAAGDFAAFGVLVERYTEVAYRAAYLIVRDGPTAEDVTQEAFIRAFRRLDTFRTGEPFRPWLLRIVTNQALNFVRGRSRRAAMLSRFARQAGAEIPSPQRQVEAAADAAVVLRALNELRPDDRLVLYLRHFLDLSESEIAAAIGRPRGTVKSRQHRALRRLRSIIDSRYPELKERTDG